MLVEQESIQEMLHKKKTQIRTHQRMIKIVSIIADRLEGEIQFWLTKCNAV